MTEQLPKVWSERRPGSWDQCTEGAYLMALVYGGWRDFPEGIYTDAERNALDASTPPDPPAGGSTFPLVDTGAKRRYGVTLHRIPDGTKAELARQLDIPGQGFAIAGSLAAFPPGHRLRRWDPAYEGGHAVAVVSLGDGLCWWGDPLAPMGFDGDRVTTAHVLQFAWYPSDARVITGGAWLADARAQRIDRLQRRIARLALEAAGDDATIDRLRERLRRIREIVQEPD